MDEKNYLDKGGLPLLVSKLLALINGKSSRSHVHSATDVTSGTLAEDRLPVVPVTKGGTGATTAADALKNLGAYGESNKPAPADIGAAPAYTYGTEDLNAGESALETGKLYFVYE